MPGKRLEGRVALVTGASRGIGAAVAKRFAEEGAHLILVARTTGALEEIDDAVKSVGGSATLVPLDLRDFDKIDQLGAAVFERFKRLDVLVGNAAMLGPLTPVPHIKPTDWERVMALNVTANYRLIRIFDPLLRQSETGRAIFVTSVAARKFRAYWGPYSASKAALEALVLTWAQELNKTNVRVNVLDPGPVRTSMRAEAYPGEDPQTLRTPESLTETFVALAEAACTRHGEIVQAP